MSDVVHGRDAAGVQRVGNGLPDADDALFRVRGWKSGLPSIGLRGVSMDDKDERPLLRTIEREAASGSASGSSGRPERLSIVTAGRSGASCDGGS